MTLQSGTKAFGTKHLANSGEATAENLHILTFSLANKEDV